MIESLHYVIDQLAGVLLTLLGEVEIKHGGFESGMAHVRWMTRRLTPGSRR